MNLNVKKYFFLFKYYGNRVLKSISTMKCVSFFILSLSFVLFGAVLIPNFTHRMPIVRNWNKILEVEGDIIQSDSSRNDLRKIKINIGGYTTNSDNLGHFKLKFASKINYDIPLILSIQNKIILTEWLSFNGNVKLNKDIILK